MFSLLNRHRKFIVVALLLVGSYLFFSHNVNRQQQLPWYNRAILWMIAPVQHLATSIVDGVTNAWTHYVFLVGVTEDNVKLRRRLIEYEFKNEALIEAAIENERLRKLLAFRENIVAQKISAQVIALDLSSQFQMVRVDRGTKDGIVLGMPVLGDAGVVGQIFRVAGHYADVLLLTDRNSSIDVIIQRSRARGIIVGAGRKNFNMRFKYLSNVEDVKVGDLVITSGLDGVFPGGFSVGYVTEVSRPEVGIFQRAEIQPTVDFAKISEVLVVLKQKRPEFPSLPVKGDNG